MINERVSKEWRCVARVFTDQLEPERLPRLAGKEGQEWILAMMRGHSYNIRVNERSVPQARWPKPTEHQMGKYAYVGIWAIPESRRDLMAEIKGRGALTGDPELNQLSRPGTMAEIGENPLEIEQVNVGRLLPYMVVLSQERDEYRVLYRGLEVGETVLKWLGIEGSL